MDGAIPLEPWQTITGRAISGQAIRPEVPILPCYGEVPNEETRLLANQLVEQAEARGGRPRPMSGSFGAGPGIPILYSMLALTISTPIIMLTLGLLMTNCNSSGQTPQYPVYIWLPFIPLLLVYLMLEFKAFTYMVIPALQVLGRFEVFNKDFGFSAWLLYAVGQSALNFTSHATFSLFTATQIVSTRCPSATLDDATDIWKATMKQSWVAALANIEMWQWTLFVWFCSGVPPMFVFLQTLPRWGDWRDDQGPGKEKQIELKVSSTGRYNYTNIFGVTMLTGTFFNTMAEGTLSTPITEVGIAYPVYRAQQDITAVEQVVQSNSATDLHDVERRLMTGLQHLNSVCPRVFLRIFGVGMLKTALQTNIQVSLIALHCEVLGSTDIKFQAFFSVVVSAFGVLLLLKTFVDMEYFFPTTINRLQDIIQGLPDDGSRKSLERKIGRTKFYVWAIRASMATCAWVMLYAIIKFVMTYHCPHHMWNLSGCVILDVQ